MLAGVVATIIMSLLLQVFSKQLVEKVRELDSQKNVTEKAFHGFLPPSLVRDMKRENVRCYNFIRHPFVSAKKSTEACAREIRFLFVV